ncbi:hypothetical protein Pr1d_16380 [Bythopirellula goksoeyrii]|uniref:Uncharacterized protein n=1 Tax=Bythopirellula goksoeyrii TaxID=1400387 RepID=A0A5B9QA75_9BACT|nr:hypothetical protein Pr1d_16380 [Bythopirellula goksoeyrii]
MWMCRTFLWSTLLRLMVREWFPSREISFGQTSCWPGKSQDSPGQFFCNESLGRGRPGESCWLEGSELTPSKRSPFAQPKNHNCSALCIAYERNLSMHDLHYNYSESCFGLTFQKETRDSHELSP